MPAITTTTTIKIGPAAAAALAAGSNHHRDNNKDDDHKQGGGGLGGGGEEKTTTTKKTSSSLRIMPSSGATAVATAALLDEFWASTDLLFQTHTTWLLILGPIAVMGDAMGLLGDAARFALSGIALIPCAERLSFITEQVALHTNGTIGALLNATFGNAPELLISVAALRAGFYRVVQLAMLGSVLTNMLLVFGVSCFIGGVRWQVQTLRITSGNVNIVMLLVATAGSLFPAALKLSGQLGGGTTTFSRAHPDVPTREEVIFCRVNACVMLFMYICYLVFQLGTHKEEFDEDNDKVGVGASSSRAARRNLFCQRYVHMARTAAMGGGGGGTTTMPLKSEEVRSLLKRTMSDRKVAPLGDVVALGDNNDRRRHHAATHEDDSTSGSESAWMESATAAEEGLGVIGGNGLSTSVTRAIRPRTRGGQKKKGPLQQQHHHNHRTAASFDDDSVTDQNDDDVHAGAAEVPLISMRVGVIWLFIITLCVSAMSDILVDTIDGFARRMNMSEVFTSMVIIPFFSNVAEQVSAFLFAFRNEMDLCVGVTIGSAVQIMCFVLPGSVIIGMMIDRSMTLYFHGYETACLFFGVVTVGAILQGGTTNWLTGAMLVGIYIMLAAGVWFHELEDLTVDAEELIRNATAAAAFVANAGT